jgi:cytochrome-b5 reductase
VGHVDFLIKNYGDQGTMSQFLHQVDVGSTDIAFQHIAPNVKIQAPFPQEHVVMLAGGTGITPMLQALHAILGTTDNPKQTVTLLYGSQTNRDILGQSLLDEWARDYSDRLKVVHVLSEEPSLSSWAGRRGFIDLELIAEHLPSSSHDVIVLVCGPPAMYQALCGPRQESDRVSGILGQMGFASDKVYKF